MRLFIPVTLFLVSLTIVRVEAQVVPFDSDRWEIGGATTVQMEYNGRKALYLLGASAVIKDDAIEDGIIEFDVAFSAQRGFSGLFWRVQEDGNREEFYFRPHQSGNPDANQYNPVLNGIAGWQLYYGPSYAAPIRYKFNEWMHVRVVFAGETADIYVDSAEPVLSVNLKNPSAPGKIGVYASGFAPAYFANFEYKALDEPAQMGTPIPEPQAPQGALTRWTVSNPFEEAALSGTTDLASSVLDTLSWQSVRSESTGVLNLARYVAGPRERNTVLAKTILTSEAGETRMLRFGYSDRASVYLNGQLLYRGSNDYMSRDYRYLGTIGLFDAVPVRLRRGTNELVIAVSEDFGGWGLIAVQE